MSKKKTTASEIIFNSAVQVMSDVIDFSIERHTEASGAQEIYERMQAALAGSRRNLRGLLKKRWFKGPERDRCLQRARELREAELAIGYLIRASRVSAEMQALFLDNVEGFPGMTELMGHFKIKPQGRRK